jgi:hypothetical protein
MTPPACSDNSDAETPQRGGALKGIHRSLRKLRSYLSLSSPSTHSISPPSYQSVLLEKHSKPGVGVLCKTEKEWIIQLKKTPPSYTAQHSAKMVEKWLAMLLSLDAHSTLGWAAQHPEEVVKRVRRFLLHCLARDHDLVHLTPLSRADRKHFMYLGWAYIRFWHHQIWFGWATTTPEVKLQAREVFVRFIDNPARAFGHRLIGFIGHMMDFWRIHRLPQGSTLFGETDNRLRTVQALRSRGWLVELERRLRVNSQLLEAVTSQENEGICAAIRAGIEEERRNFVPAYAFTTYRSYLTRDAITDEWYTIRCDGHCKYPPFLQPEEMADVQ